MSTILDLTAMVRPEVAGLPLLEALHRLRDGSYGTCSECGDPIAPRRLRAIPEASMCVRCQERIEPGQASQTVRAFYPEPRVRADEPDDV